MLTATQIAAKRHERTMASRIKRLNRAQRRQDSMREGRNRASWLAEQGKLQQDAAKALERRHQQALESRRTNRAMSNHTPKGVIGRIKAFFRRTP